MSAATTTAKPTPRRGPPPNGRHWLRDLDPDDARAAIVQALEREAGCCSKAARRLETSRMNLWRLLRDLGMLTMPAEVEERARRRFRLAG
jgi:transcriptional regulator with GAF, ATPase, and Fis domain